MNTKALLEPFTLTLTSSSLTLTSITQESSGLSLSGGRPRRKTGKYDASAQTVAFDQLDNEVPSSPSKKKRSAARQKTPAKLKKSKITK